MSRHSTRRKRSKPRSKNKKIVNIPVFKPIRQLTLYETILDDLGYDPLGFTFLSKSIDNLKFKQKSTGKILDLRI